MRWRWLRPPLTERCLEVYDANALEPELSQVSRDNRGRFCLSSNHSRPIAENACTYSLYITIMQVPAVSHMVDSLLCFAARVQLPVFIVQCSYIQHGHSFFCRIYTSRSMFKNVT